jgi:hypothetical protein
MAFIDYKVRGTGNGNSVLPCNYFGTYEQYSRSSILFDISLAI